ncbi:MAG: DUF3373 family protein [Acidobacteriota bacterium]|nr:DUF3373 family protein [Acidobacteriota bacterium]
MKRSVSLLLALALPWGFGPSLAAEDGTARKIEELEKQIQQLKELIEDEEIPARLDQVERKSAMDRLLFTGELRIAADSIDGTQPAYYNGMMLQKGLVDTLFYTQTSPYGSPVYDPAWDPADPQSIYQLLEQNVAANYGEYLYFTSRLGFDDLKQAVGGFPPDEVAALMELLTPGTYVPARDYTNDIMYTTRLRMNMQAEISPNLKFHGRLTMYKVWGDSTGVQVFNGQPNTMNVDGTTVGVPGSDLVHVDRAFFSWNHIGGTGFYLSLGRRPSTAGPPLEIREGRLRGGTPTGHVVDYQFDGATLGWVVGNKWNSVLRFCYGVGYESGFGNGEQLQAPADRLKDVNLGGLNIDVFSSPRMFVQATAFRAFDVTDGFNALIVMPVDPVTGNPAPGPAVMRMTPSANLGDLDLLALLVERHDGPVHWFVSMASVSSDPKNVTTPFGGLFSDPFETPQSHSGSSVYAGFRWDLPNGSTQLGVEYNHGSKYWFNFTHAADDIVLSKLATRGDVWEFYWNQELASRARLRLSVLDYKYDYSGSGWHVGAPKDLSATPILGFPTYDDVLNVRLALTIKY